MQYKMKLKLRLVWQCRRLKHTVQDDETLNVEEVWDVIDDYHYAITLVHGQVSAHLPVWPTWAMGALFRGRYSTYSHQPRMLSHTPVIIESLSMLCGSRHFQDIELEAQLCSILGKLYQEVMHMADRASHYYRQCIERALSCVFKSFNKEEWFKSAVSYIGQKQKQVRLSTLYTAHVYSTAHISHATYMLYYSAHYIVMLVCLPER
jgi:hypothetical protein